MWVKVLVSTLALTAKADLDKHHCQLEGFYISTRAHLALTDYNNMRSMTRYCSHFIKKGEFLTQTVTLFRNQRLFVCRPTYNMSLKDCSQRGQLVGDLVHGTTKSGVEFQFRVELTGEGSLKFTDLIRNGQPVSTPDTQQFVEQKRVSKEDVQKISMIYGICESSL